jgi:hypothetical protein
LDLIESKEKQRPRNWGYVNILCLTPFIPTRKYVSRKALAHRKQRMGDMRVRTKDGL